MIVIMRRPELMEDEGHFHLLGCFETPDEAIKFVRGYTDNDKGYFRVSSLVRLEDDGHNIFHPLWPESLTGQATRGVKHKGLAEELLRRWATYGELPACFEETFFKVINDYLRIANAN